MSRTTVILVLLTLFQAGHALAQAKTTEELGTGTSVRVASGSEAAAPRQRLRGTGIFNDPNDLALALVVAVPFVSAVAGHAERRVVSRIAALGALALLVAAIYATNSRGGMLGLAAVAMPSVFQAVSHRVGRFVAVAVAALLVAGMIATGPSRASELDAGEESAQGRIHAWSAGLSMFKSSPVTGVGFGRFTEYNELVAHNSFVHTLAELGFLGAFSFVGMGYWFFRTTRRRVQSEPQQSADRWVRALRRSGVGFVVCACFLSRQYNVIPFILLALSACYRQVTNQDITGTVDDGSEVVPVRAVVPRIAALTAGLVMAAYVAVRVFAVWSVA